jgi:hypothetical protein
MTQNHNALVIPVSDCYAVSCSCGWNGDWHDAPGPAEREAKGHEADPPPKSDPSAVDRQTDVGGEPARQSAAALGSLPAVVARPLATDQEGGSGEI